MNSQNSKSFQVSPANISEILYKAVEENSERPALVLPDISWTYAELGSLISAASNILRDHLINKGSRIAIIGNNHPAYIVAYFAAQCLGASTVEVGRFESLNTLLGIVRETGVCFVLTDRDDLKTSLQGHVHTESFQKFLSLCVEKAVKTEPLPKISSSIDSAEAASIVYTSGTTGLPKGVILTQGNFCFIIASIVDYLKLSKEDRYALILPLCHTYGKTVMLTSLAIGAAVVLLLNFQNLPNFLSLVESKRCTLLSAVPYHAHVLLKWGNLSKYDLSSLRAITFSGNKLPPANIDQLREKLPGAQIFSMYGLTESTTRACYVPPELIIKKKDSCGRPLPGVELKIIGEDGSTLPSGQVGEVLLRGPNVMKGYFLEPELTAKTIVNGWLKTGDLGYLDEDGFLYLEGRTKEIIKCAGERISPAEIENVLIKHPCVADVSVKGTSDPVLGEIVHAYIVQSGSVKEEELRTYCAKQLSHHKIPRRYTFVDILPKTATGKVKKYLL